MSISCAVACTGHPSLRPAQAKRGVAAAAALYENKSLAANVDFTELPFANACKQMASGGCVAALRKFTPAAVDDQTPMQAASNTPLPTVAEEDEVLHRQGGQEGMLGASFA